MKRLYWSVLPKSNCYVRRLSLLHHYTAIIPYTLPRADAYIDILLLPDLASDGGVTVYAQEGDDGVDAMS